MKEITIFDRETEFNEVIKPKMEEIKNLCIRYDIPFIAVFATGNTEAGTNYQMNGLMPGIQNITLKDNKLNNVFKTISGYTQPGSVNSDNYEDDFPDEV